MTPVAASSPLTGSANVKLLRTLNCKTLIDSWRRGFNMDVTAELKGHPEIQVYECQDTGLRFFSPDDVAGSDAFYAQLQKFDWYYEKDKWEYRTALADLLAHCPGGRVLEVGCGDGAFIRTAVDAGLVATGIEINPKAVAVAKERGLPVELTDLADAANANAGAMDAVCAFQVLEHVPDVRGFLNACTQMLKPGGRLILAVPNGGGVMEYSDTLLDLPPHHMSQWTPAAFQSIQKLLPLRLVHLKVAPLHVGHVGLWAQSTWARMRARHPRVAWLFNRATRRIATTVMRLGGRWFAEGHTLYATFVRI